MEKMDHIRICAIFLLLSLLSVYSFPYFYIYEWPEYMNDVWPKEQAPLDKSSPYSHDFRGNNGAGKVIAPDVGYFSTWQFSLYKTMISRLRVSEYRTYDPSKASAFIIPFDLGTHSFLDHVNGKPRVASPHGWRAVEYLKESMKQDVFWKNGGHDHFVIFSLTSYQIIGIGAKVFMTQLCQNCSVLTIETAPSFTSRKYYSGKSRKYWYAVPYPSSFHWWEGIRQLPWERSPTDPSRSLLVLFVGSTETQTPASNILRRKMKAECLQDAQRIQEKKRTSRHRNHLLRHRSLIQSTEEQQEEVEEEEEGRDGCLWVDTAHSCSGVVNQTDSMLRYRDAVFCLAPPGDSLTRKSLFDSLVTGCIPVINAQATVNQYLWHLPTQHIEDISIFIPRVAISDQGVSFLQVLRSIPKERIRRMQQRIRELAPLIQYSVVPNDILPIPSSQFPSSSSSSSSLSSFSSTTNEGSDVPHNSSTASSSSLSSMPGGLLDLKRNIIYPHLSHNKQTINSHSTTIPHIQSFSTPRSDPHHWRPPFPDAVDVIIDKLLDPRTIEPKEGFSREEVVALEFQRDNIALTDPPYSGLLPLDGSTPQSPNPSYSLLPIFNGVGAVLKEDPAAYGIRTHELASNSHYVSHALSSISSSELDHDSSLSPQSTTTTSSSSSSSISASNFPTEREGRGWKGKHRDRRGRGQLPQSIETH